MILNPITLEFKFTMIFTRKFIDEGNLVGNIKISKSFIFKY